MICLEEFHCDTTTFILDTTNNLSRWERENDLPPSHCPAASVTRPGRRLRPVGVLLEAILIGRRTNLRSPISEAETEALCAPANQEMLRTYWFRAVTRQVPAGQFYIERMRADRAIGRQLDRLGSREYFYLFLQAVQFGERCAIRELEKQSFDRFCQLVALDTLIALNNLPRNSSERSEFDRLLGEFTNGLRDLRQAIEGLLNWQTGRARGFGPAHADIINGFVDRVNTCRTTWQQLLHHAVLAQPPTPEQMLDYERLLELERYRDSVRQRREELDRRRRAAESDLTTLRSLRNRGTLGPRQIAAASANVRPFIERILRDGEVDQHEREQLDEQLEQTDEEISRLRQERQRVQAEEQTTRASGAIGREITQYTQRLRTVRARIAEYLRLQNAEQFRATQTASRNNLLRDFDALISRLATTRRFATPGLGDATQQETYQWQAYQGLLERLILGIGRASLEHLFSVVFIGYGAVNADRDVGIRNPSDDSVPRVLNISTYSGHGQNRDALTAVDISTSEVMPVLATAPDVFVVPVRFVGRAGIRQGESYEYTELRMVEEHTRSSNDLADVFGKIAYGLLMPPAGQGRTQSLDIERLMPNEEAQRMAAQRADALMVREGPVAPLPAEVGQNPDGRTILAGLGYHNLTAAGMRGVSPRGRELLEQERRSILLELEARVRTHRSLSADVDLWRDEGLQADQPRTGLRHLIVYPDLPQVVRWVQEVIRADRTAPNGITARLWQFLWDLRGANAPPSRRGQAVTVDYLYRSRRDPRRLLCIRVLISHVFEAFAVSDRCQMIARVGSTGNAVAPHNHIEINLFPLDPRTGETLENDRIGSILPHEFFPLF